MVKKALKGALGIGTGIALGGTILPRLFFPQNYNSTWPPLWQHALLNFAVAFLVAFLVCLFIEWGMSKKS